MLSCYCGVLSKVLFECLNGMRTCPRLPGTIPLKVKVIFPTVPTHKWPCHGHDKTRPVLSLSKLKPFEEGSKRSCYVHPDNPNLCVKVVSGNSSDPKKLAEQRLEIEDFALLNQRNSSVLFERFPRNEGVVNTDLGQGIVNQLLRDFDGQISRNFGILICKDGLSLELKQAIVELKHWLRDQQCLTRDTGPHNMVAVRLAKDKWRLVIIEGMINRKFFWLRRASRWFANYMLERELRKFDRRVQSLLKLWKESRSSEG